jgi:hypothetical protein
MISEIKNNDDTGLIQDFKNELRKVFSSEKIDNIEIIVTDDPVEIKSSIVKTLKGSYQSFYIKSTSNKILIYAPNIDGRSNGVYWYLQQLGYRWYFPGDLWSYTPVELTEYLFFDEIVKPDFRNRTFFGGGGYRIGHPADPNNYAKSEWVKWQKRNLFGEEIHTKGHEWQDVIRRNLEEFKKHPEYLTKPLNYNKPDLKTKFCVSNTGLIDLFIRDRINKLNETINKYGVSHIRAQNIGAEPSDGGGHCECNECVKIGSISDRVFFLANKLAYAIEKSHPNVLVSLLAYGHHSAVPSIDLHPNIYVTIVPFLYQHETMPEQFIKEWKQKKDNIQYRDYWALLISRKGKPMKGFMNSVEGKVKMLKKYKVDKMRVESTYSIGAAGIPLYLMGRLTFDNSLDHDTELNELLLNCFGEAKPIMEKIFLRWSDFDFLPELEKEIVFEDFKKAKKLVSNPKIKLRINAFEKYVNFLFYAYSVDQNKRNKDKINNSLDNLIDYSWSILPDLMVHSVWLPSPFMRVYNRERYNKGYLKNQKNKPSSFFENKKTIPHYFNSQKTDIIVAKDVKNNRSDFNIISSLHRDSDYKRVNKLENVIFKSNQSYSFIYSADSKKTVTYNLITEIINPKRIGSAFIIGLYDENDELIYTETFKGESNSIEGIIPFPSKGVFRITMKVPNLRTTLNWPDKNNVTFGCGQKVRLEKYVYKVDDNLANLIVYSKAAIKILNKDGKKLITELSDNLYSINTRNEKLIVFKSSSIIQIVNSNNCYFTL